MEHAVFAFELGSLASAMRSEGLFDMRAVFGVDAFPQMLVRVGWAAVNADPLPSTPRRALSDVVAKLDGSPFG